MNLACRALLRRRVVGYGVKPPRHSEPASGRMAGESPQAHSRLPFPPNLFIVGTVNVDETTYMFSPKVLDRSTCIEIRVGTESLVPQRPDMTRIGATTIAERRAMVDAGGDARVEILSADLLKRLEDLHRMLAEHGHEFGHRTYQEMLRFAGLVLLARPSTSDETVLDFLVMQKGSASRYHQLDTRVERFDGCAPLVLGSSAGRRRCHRHAPSATVGRQDGENVIGTRGNPFHCLLSRRSPRPSCRSATGTAPSLAVSSCERRARA